MTTAIFIKTFPKDAPWLAYCLRSIHKFCTGFEEVVVVAPEGMDLSALTAERVVRVTEPDNGYMYQQVVKLNADRYTTADYILYVDSDCVFLHPVTPDNYLVAGLPDWWVTPFERAHKDAQHAWRQVMHDFLGEPTEWEFMRRHPHLIPRWANGCLRDFIRHRHKMGMEEYVMSRPGNRFSEFNCIGFFLHTYFRNYFYWRNTIEDLPAPTMRQFWSHGGLSPEIQNEIDAILA